MKNNIKAVIYGDSLLKGVVYDPNTGRHSFAKGSAYAMVGEAFGIDITNKSHFGFTVKDGKKVISDDLEAGEVYDYALVEFGGNDSDFKWEQIAQKPDGKHYPKVCFDEYLTTLREMIKKLREAGSKPVLMTLPPVFAHDYLTYLCRRGLDKNAILSWLGEENTIYRHQELYSLTIAKFACEEKIPLCDVRSEFLRKRNCSKLMCADGIHPNKYGQRLIACTFYDFLKNFKFD